MTLGSEWVERTNLSQVGEDEFIIRYRVFVNLITDDNFKAFFDTMYANIDLKRGCNLLFMGMASTGKTTMIEYFINVLTGKTHSPTPQCAIELEDKGNSVRKTQSVCRYEIEYTCENKLFSVSLIDTPGFADVGNLEKDDQNIKSILKAVGKIDRLDSVSYLLNSALTRKTLEPLNSFCRVFSVLPSEAFESVSTIITFCDNKNQANGIRDVLNDILNGINDRPCLFMDNPWSQHGNNKNKEEDIADNTENHQQKLEEKTNLVTNYILEIIKSNKSFQPKGMSALNDLKEILFKKLSDLSVEESQKKYDRDLEEFCQLNKIFKDLSVLGDISLILHISKRTYQQQLEITLQVGDQNKADKLNEIVNRLQSFIDALISSESKGNIKKQ